MRKAFTMQGAPMLFRLHNGRGYAIHILSRTRAYAFQVTHGRAYVIRI
jgi:hypothetical protein